MERKIGEIFEVDDIKLICLQDNNKNILESCKNCYFFNKKHQCLQILCANSEREDGNNVHFKEITDQIITREEEIANAADVAFPTKDYYIPTMEILGFTFGAHWADEHPKSPWISVKNDLPCNHEELLNPDDKRNTSYVVAIIHGYVIMSRMYKLNGKWYWENDEPTHWFPIPKLP